MPRETKTAPEIQAEVQRVLLSMDEIREDQAQVTVPEPTLLAEVAPNGCNWTMMTFGGDAAAHQGAIRFAVAEVMARWNLQD